jgi:hypothetical protein
MTTITNARGALLGLYRDVLRVHRKVLPPPMRALGDRYMRDEFRRHKEGNTTESQWRAFAAEWQQYVATLNGSGAEMSGDITPDIMETMSPEQKEQLAKLHNEAHRLGAALKDSTP